MKAETSRTELSIKNMSSTLTTQVLTMILKFVVRTIFVYRLGAIYLGINGLYSNIINVLSFAELGIGTAITFSLYKPLAENDNDTVSALMTLFKHVYTIIAAAVFILGMAVLPVLHIFINVHVKYAYLIYVLFVINASVSYLFTYKRTMLIADQRGYISVINQFVFTLIASVAQIVVLLTLNSFILYCVSQIICTIASNIAISFRAQRLYSGIDYSSQNRIKPNIFRKLVSNTLGMIGSRVGGLAFDVTDNLVISSFIGVYWVGIYSNYTLIISSFTQVVGGLLNSFVASIGNLAVTNNKEKSYSILREHQFINFAIAVIVTAGMASCFNRFILLWVGAKYVLSDSIVTLIILNYATFQLRQTDLAFISAYGLFHKVGWKSVFEAIINISLSIIFVSVFKLGIIGVLLATAISNISVNLWYEPWLVIQLGIKIKGQNTFYLEYVLYFFLIMVFTPIWVKLSHLNPLSGWFGLILSGLMSVACSSLLLLLVFGRTKNFKFFKEVSKKVLKRGKKFA